MGRLAPPILLVPSCKEPNGGTVSKTPVLRLRLSTSVCDQESWNFSVPAVRSRQGKHLPGRCADIQSRKHLYLWPTTTNWNLYDFSCHQVIHPAPVPSLDFPPVKPVRRVWLSAKCQTTVRTIAKSCTDSNVTFDNFS